VPGDGAGVIRVHVDGKALEGMPETAAVERALATLRRDDDCVACRALKDVRLN
jgi:hypothetical protein